MIDKILNAFTPRMRTIAITIVLIAIPTTLILALAILARGG